MEETFCYNWVTGEEHSVLFDVHSEVADALLGFLDPVDSPLLPLDSLFQDNMDSTLISSSPMHLSTFPNGEEGGNFLPLPSFSDPAFLSLPSPPPSNNSSYLYHGPKRHCGSSELYIQEQPPPLFEPCPFYYPTVLAELEAPPPATMAAVAPVPNDGSSLSLQSVAARERRKRISEKTQELGRLIPGGSKMNTAEMLQAALKYVKFLQAQVAVLRHLSSVPGCKSEKEHLQVLLASAGIQERLSAEGMCMVPYQI